MLASLDEHHFQLLAVFCAVTGFTLLLALNVSFDPKQVLLAGLAQHEGERIQVHGTVQGFTAGAMVSFSVHNSSAVFLLYAPDSASLEMLASGKQLAITGIPSFKNNRLMVAVEALSYG